MAKIDPEQERERLAARYAAMSDLELRKVGVEPASLTEWARAAFSEELKKRGLEWKPEPRVAKADRGCGNPNPAGKLCGPQFCGARPGFSRGRRDQGIFLRRRIACRKRKPLRPKARKKTQLLVRAKELRSARELLAEKREAESMAHRQSGEPSEADRPVILRRYRDMPAAFVEKSVLEDAGIECFLQDDNVVRMDWLWSNAMGGIKLIVREKDAADAEKILGQGTSSEQAGGTGQSS